MRVRKTYKDESRKEYGREVEQNEGLTQDELRTGALMRIANATELMAKRYQDLIDEQDRYKRSYESSRDSNRRLLRRLSALRGVITKLKKAQGGRK